MRHTSGRMKRDTYRAYGIARRGGHCEIDPLVPLGPGNADALQNLWPQPFEGKWGSEAKYQLELRLVCLSIVRRSVLTRSR